MNQEIEEKLDKIKEMAKREGLYLTDDEAAQILAMILEEGSAVTLATITETSVWLWALGIL